MSVRKGTPVSIPLADTTSPSCKPKTKKLPPTTPMIPAGDLPPSGSLLKKNSALLSTGLLPSAIIFALSSVPSS